jgi:glutamyl-tRNA reductase
LATKREILKIETAVILGAGNVAWHLGHALRNIGIRILQVYNRTSESGKLLAESIGAGFT